MKMIISNGKDIQCEWMENWILKNIQMKFNSVEVIYYKVNAFLMDVYFTWNFANNVKREINGQYINKVMWCWILGNKIK